MPTISKRAGLHTTYTNHSVRSTSVTTLRQDGVHANDKMAVTGHKSSQSLLHYSSTFAEKRHPMSYTLLEKMSYSIQPVPSTTTATKKVPPSAALGAPPKEESPEMKPNISDFIPCSQPDTRKMPSAPKLEELPLKKSTCQNVTL